MRIENQELRFKSQDLDAIVLKIREKEPGIEIKESRSFKIKESGISIYFLVPDSQFLTL